MVDIFTAVLSCERIVDCLVTSGGPQREKRSTSFFGYAFLRFFKNLKKSRELSVILLFMVDLNNITSSKT